MTLKAAGQAMRRPVVVIQADAYNESWPQTMLVEVFTSSTSPAALPRNVFLSASATGPPRDSVVNVTAIAILDRDDLGEPVGVLPAHLRDDLDRGLRQGLDL